MDITACTKVVGPSGLGCLAIAIRYGELGCNELLERTLFDVHEMQSILQLSQALSSTFLIFPRMLTGPSHLLYTSHRAHLIKPYRAICLNGMIAIQTSVTLPLDVEA